MTWRNKSINRLYAFALASVFALALAGCGGGGGGAPAKKCSDTGQVGTYPNCTDPPEPTVDEQRNQLSPADLFKVLAAEEDAKDANALAQSELELAEARVLAIAADAAAARAAANTAMAARTDYEAADEEAKKAEAVKTRADAAIIIIRKAAADAKTAYDDAMKAVTVATAQQARDDAETNAEKARAYTRNDVAAGGNGIGLNSGTVASGDAKKAAQAAAATHVLGLLKKANKTSQTDADTRKAEVAKVVASIGDAAGVVTGSELDRSNNSATTDGSNPVGVSVAWNENTKANPDNDPPLNEIPMYQVVTITGVQGGDIVSETRADRAAKDINGDGDTEDPTEAAVTNNAKMIDGLPGFPHGFHISTSGNQIRTMVFTDKVQDTAPVTEKAAVSAKSLTNDPVSGNTVTKVGATSGTTISGVTYFEGTATTDERTAYTGTLTCPSATTECSVEVGGTSDEPTYTVTGYTFTGSRQASPAVAASDGVNNDYLAFGVWIDHDGDDNVDNGNQPELGAFAGGGDTVNGDIEGATGTATYKGAAVGVYTQGSSVDYFEGSATLTADFGADDANGTVTGTISNIVAGGVSKSDVINLNSGTISDTATITGGNARMGPGTTKDNVTTYVYNGSWSGGFYNPAMTTAGADDLTKAPGSVAGTFGVTGTDNMGTKDDATDDVTTSYVGAFGAHKQ